MRARELDSVVEKGFYDEGISRSRLKVVFNSI
jgi:hypothetical protein